MSSDLNANQQGDGPAVVLIHGTGTDSTVFNPAAGTLAESFRVISFDRRGWGGSPAGPEYRKTSIAEHSIEAAGTIRRFTEGPVTVVGLGFGAVVVLELALAEPELVAAAILIEPPLFDALPAATGGMSTDVEAIRSAAGEGGETAAYELFLEGRLPVLGAGADRFLPVADRRPAAAHTFLVELPAPTAWPLDPVRLASLEAEVTVATCPSTPPLLIEAADSLIGRIPGATRVTTRQEPTEAPAELLP
ncbi:MAG: alpha/beta hydrolase [Solirubrobacterales bacterium]|nr:alpha/beta hydrolase [Solirubrobacterales bacterium]